MIKTNNFQELIEKVNRMKKNGEVDLSVEEDLSIAIMNLISLEEHFFFTAEKTGKPGYFDLLQEIRAMRTGLKKMIKNPEGEEWCISKHLLAASMRLIEVGTKQHKMGKKVEAEEMFNKSYELFSLFFSIRLKLLDIPNIKRESLEDTDSGKPWTKEQIMTELLDCCKE